METHINHFKNYLYNLGYTPKTVTGYIRLLRQFISWCEDNGINYKKATIEELYDYQNHNRNTGNSPRTMWAKMSLVRLYYRFSKRKNSPAVLVETDRVEKKLPKHLLTREQMIEMYLDCKPLRNVFIRNKVMLGMFIFQGITRNEMELLEVKHIDFEKMRVYISSTKITNKRYLPLNPVQKRDLESYINHTRPALMKTFSKQSDCLFFSTRSNDVLTDVLNQMILRFRKELADFVSFMQLRQSNMSIWVNELGISKARYFSGLRHSSSLLRYKKTDKEKLKYKLSIVHPIERLGLDK